VIARENQMRGVVQPRVRVAIPKIKKQQ